MIFLNQRSPQLAVSKGENLKETAISSLYVGFQCI